MVCKSVLPRAAGGKVSAPTGYGWLDSDATSWAETAPVRPYHRLSMNTAVTDTQSPSIDSDEGSEGSEGGGNATTHPSTSLIDSLVETEEPESVRSASVYLDASEDGPSVAEILRELREIPDIPPSEAAILSPAPILGEVSHTPQEPAWPAPSEETNSTALPAPPRPPPSRRHSSRRRSLSSARPSLSHNRIRVSASRSASGTYDRAEVVVELHEESAAAFQDFLFWAYPHLECKVTWGNVEDVSNIMRRPLIDSF